MHRHLLLLLLVVLFGTAAAQPRICANINVVELCRQHKGLDFSDGCNRKVCLEELIQTTSRLCPREQQPTAACDRVREVLRQKLKTRRACPDWRRVCRANQ